MTPERRSFWSYDRVLMWLSVGGLLVTVIAFWAKSNDLPERVSKLELSNATTVQHGCDVDSRLARIEDKLDAVLEAVK